MRAGPLTRPRTISSGASSTRGAPMPTAAAGESPPSRSSSTAKTPGSTSRAAAVRSSGRSSAGSRAIPSCGPSPWPKPARTRGRSCRPSSRARGSTPISRSGLATPTTSAPGASWRMPGRRSRAPAPSDAAAKAREELLIAEGSDWFWWYGDDHSSAHDAEFDDLFRRHVRNVYRLLGRTVPGRAVRQQPHTDQTSLPQAEPTAHAGARHRRRGHQLFRMARGRLLRGPAGRPVRCSGATGRSPLIRQIRFGFDAERLFVCVEGTTPMVNLFGEGRQVSLTFLAPADLRFLVRQTSGAPRGPLRHASSVHVCVGHRDGPWRVRGGGLTSWKSRCRLRRSAWRLAAS